MLRGEIVQMCGRGLYSWWMWRTDGLFGKINVGEEGTMEEVTCDLY